MGETLVQAAPHTARPPDERILERVRRALWQFEPLRASGSIIEVTPDGSRVRIGGRVRTQILKDLAGYVAAATEGAAGIENAVISDTEVIRELADALAADPLTRPYVIRVEARLGLAKLRGIVPSLEVEQRALEVAHSVPLALDAMSELEIDPELSYESSAEPDGQATTAAQAGGEGANRT